MTRRSFLEFTGAALASNVFAANARTPNIIFILCDDLGYGDLETYGSTIPTPNLNQMAADGIRFTNFCSADPVCSPSRAALLTGRYPTRVGVPRVLFPDDTAGLNLDETTMADMLKGRGYKTMCIGKWHLGRLVAYLPTSRGFDEYFGIPYSNDMSPCVLMHNTEVIEEPAKLETLTARYTEHAVRFIHESKDAPFFLHMPHTFPHIPLAASKRFRGKSAQGLYGDVVEEVDWSVGQVLKALEEDGLAGNTLVMFSSDNGPWYQGSPGRLRGRKGSTYEGGIREPFLARWRGHIPQGRFTNAPASMMDIFPTITHLCGAGRPPKSLDGVNIWPLLSGEKATMERPRPLLYFDNWDLQCARWNDWKLHIARYNSPTYVPAPPGGQHSSMLPRPELYNLANDPDESYDVAPEHPEIVARIEKEIRQTIAGFPHEVQEAYAAAQATKVNPQMPAGSWPRPLTRAVPAPPRRK